MKRIFRISSVSGSVVRLDLLAVRRLVVFLEVTHGGLKLSHERFQRLDSRLDLGSASRLGIWCGVSLVPLPPAGLAAGAPSAVPACRGLARRGGRAARLPEDVEVEEEAADLAAARACRGIDRE